MAGFLDIDLSFYAQQAVDDYPQLSRQLAKAVKRATRKVSRWLVTHAAREMATKLKIKQQPLKKRFRLDFTANSVRIWFGLLEIGLDRLGAPSQNAEGVRVNGEQYDGAFYRNIYGNEGRVYIRASRNQALKHSVLGDNAKKYSRRGSSSEFMAKNSGRFPVQVLAKEIETTASAVLARFEQRLNRRYQTLLEQEIHYALQVEH